MAQIFIINTNMIMVITLFAREGLWEVVLLALALDQDEIQLVR